MQKRAAKIITEVRIKKGVSPDQNVRPKSLFHFHINAADDQISF